jgi:hypothetical protein
MRDKLDPYPPEAIIDIKATSASNAAGRSDATGR